mmetsp:Transcript_74937/g.231727  ORF Transcript_74937/g.231727 Transcript_74937/m.231727 type:complete len:252 (+) Transcript_74937:110-865(+)
MAEDLLPAHALELLGVREELHEAEQRGPAGPAGRVVALQEDLPTLAGRGAGLVLHGGAEGPHVLGDLVVGEGRVVGDLPERHPSAEGEGQLGTVSRIAQDHLRVGPLGGEVLRPHHLVLGAHAKLLVPLWRRRRTHNGPVGGARREREVVHVEDGRKGLVTQGEVPVMVGTGLSPVPHAYDLVPHGSAEHSLPPRHQEPHGGRLRVSPRQAVEAVHVAHERGPAGDHLVPVVVDRPEKNRGYVHGHTSIPS